MTQSPAESQKQAIAVEKLLDKLLAELGKPASAPGCNVFLRLSIASSNPRRWQRLKLVDGLANTFRERLSSAILHAVEEGGHITAYEHQQLTDEQIAFLKTDIYPELKAWLDDVPSADWSQIFLGDPDTARLVKYHVTVLDIDGESDRLKVFSRQPPSALLHRGNILARFSQKQHQFSEIEGSVFEFSMVPQFFEWKGYVFILNMNVFETLTNMRNITIGKAKAALDGVSKVENLNVAPLKSMASLIEASPRLARKLASAQAQGVIDALSAERIAERAKQKGLPFTITKVGAVYNIQADITNRYELRDLIDLLTDNFLRSDTTHFEYRVFSKSRTP